MYKNYLKPAMDIIFGSILLIILSPLMLLGTIAAAIDTKGNPLFVHTRPGLNEKPFNLLKLRTMRAEHDSQGRERTNIERITPVGKILRKTSIDELPQLLNVLRGDISLVGPRPLEMRYLPHYTTRQRIRHNVKPGITGLAQINGRNTLSWQEKFELDIRYVESISFCQDINILARTVLQVLFRSDQVNSGENHTMEPFIKKSQNRQPD